MSKIDLVYAPASRVQRRNGLQTLLRPAHALLRALQDSRARAARNVIHNYRHLLPEQVVANPFQEGRKAITRQSQGNLKGK
jgi:hypothetical protein